MEEDDGDGEYEDIDEEDQGFAKKSAFADADDFLTSGGCVCVCVCLSAYLSVRLCLSVCLCVSCRCLFLTLSLTLSLPPSHCLRPC